MSVKLITQLNPFSNEREVQEIESSSIQDIIRKIDCFKAVNTGWRVLINDKIVTDFTEVANDGDTVYIKIVPEGDNQDVGVGEKIAGGALVLGGLALTIFTSGIGASIGISLIGAGIGLFAGGVAMYNMDIPSIKNRDTPEQSPSIRGSKNQSRPLSSIPILFGKRRIYSDLAATPYTWVDSNGDQYLYQLFSCGQKDQVIDTSSIKLGETNIVEYSSSGNINNVTAGTDSLINLSIAYGQETPPFFDKCIHEEMINAELKKIVEESDGAIIRTTPDNTEEINVDIFFLSGLGKYDDDNDLVSTSVQVEAYYKAENANDSDYELLGYFNSGSNIISGSELKTKRFSVHKTGLEPGKYTVKVVRVTDDHDDDNKIIDTVYLGSIRAIKNEQAVSQIRCEQLTLIGLKIKASEKLNNYVEQLNFISQSQLPVYSGSSSGASQWATLGSTSNPASAAIYAMQGELSQQKLNDSEIDWPAFEKLYRWCAANGYECNEYVYNEMSISEILSCIASTCRAEIFRFNGKITVIQDIQRDSFVQMFTPRNSWDYQEQIIIPSIPDAMSLQFPDKNSGYAEQELKVYNTPSGNKENEPDVVQDVPLWGVTSSVQARKLGMYKYAVSKNRPILHKFSADFEYMLCTKGDWIKYAGDIALAGITQGRIKEVIRSGSTITGFVSDELISMESNKQYSVRIRKDDGTASLYSIVNNETESNTVIFSGELGENAIQEGNLFTFGTSGNDSIDLIVTDIQCGENLTAEITTVEYSPEIFGVDSPDFVLPEFENKITDVIYAADNKVDVSEWQIFTVYNDSVSKPSLPTGTGNDNGWHTNLTPNTRWQSSKRSKNINTGYWGAPVNIAYSDAIKNLYSNHIVTLYRELGDGEAPMISTGITSAMTYSFADNSIIWESSNGSNGWSTQYPSNPTRPVYVTSATAYGKGSTDTIAASEWAKPIAVGQNGVNGISVCTINLYKRSLSQPEKPYVSGVYCFNDGEFSWKEPSQSNGWQRDIPPLDEQGLPIWTTHVTALSTKDSAYQEEGNIYDEIDSSEWSTPEQYSANEIWSKAEIEEYIKNQINDSSTPYIYAEPQQIGFAVNSSNYVPVNQTITFKIHVLQFNTEVDFIIGDLSDIIPEGFSYSWNDETHELTLTALQAKRLFTQNWIIPLVFKEYKARWGYIESGTDEINRYVNKHYELLTTKPENWENSYTDYFVSDNGTPVQNENSQWSTNTYYELITDVYGSIVYDTENTTKNVQISIVAVKGGRYKGQVTSLQDLQSKMANWQDEYNGLVIGDYFSWTGNTVSSSLSQSGQFENLCCYCYVNKTEYQWKKDNDRSHNAEIVSDIVDAATNELNIAQANPDVYNYFNKLFASIIVAKKIIANEATIEEIFSKNITLQSGGSLEGYDSQGRLGFGFYSDGHAVLKNVTIDGYPTNEDLDDVSDTLETLREAYNTTESNLESLTTEFQTLSEDYSNKVESVSNSLQVIEDNLNDCVYVNTGIGQQGSSDPTKGWVKISKEGLLTAENAVIRGKIYASEGEFSGWLTQGTRLFMACNVKITATNGDTTNPTITYSNPAFEGSIYRLDTGVYMFKRVNINGTIGKPHAIVHYCSDKVENYSPFTIYDFINNNYIIANSNPRYAALLQFAPWSVQCGDIMSRFWYEFPLFCSDNSSDQLVDIATAEFTIVYL